MNPAPSPEDRAAFERETARFREVLARGRSANQLVLFDLLVDRSRDQRSPKELEIALAMFGNEATRDASPESGVRVYVHRLRKRIDEHYRSASGPRLTIPKGEYRIVLEHSEESAPAGFAARTLRAAHANPALALGLLTIACGALALAGWNLFSSAGINGSAAARRQALVGRPNQTFQPLIVVGDSLALAETRDQRSINRLIMDPAIRTRDEFGSYLKAHPETFYRLYDFNLNFAPIRTVEAAWQVQDALYPVDTALEEAGRMVPLAKLTTDQSNGSDIVYVGRLSQLGTLAPRVFAGSRFRLLAWNRIEDTASGTQYQSAVYQDPQLPTGKDYGYFAIREGGPGKLLVTLSGLGDRGAASVAELLDSAQDLAQLRRTVGTRRNFEALFEITGEPGSPSARRLIAAGALP